VDVEVSSGTVLATSWEDESLLVFDADDGSLVDRVAGFERPSGVATGLGRIFVADTAADRLIVLDELTYGIIDSWPVDDAPTVVKVDEASARVHVACVGGNSLASFDVRAGQSAGTIFLGGLGYPQGMVVDSSNGRVFVSYSLSAKRQGVAVIDGREPRLASIFSLDDLGPVSSTYALAIDERERLLYLSTANALVAVDIDTGQVQGEVTSVGVRSPFGLSIGPAGRVVQGDLKGAPASMVRGGSER
jgi:DNA-binding beta-propeller fold protein YncE